jgi:transposase
MVSLMPLRHWTDSKIRCHILTCIVALAYLRILRIKLMEAGHSQQGHGQHAHPAFLPGLATEKTKPAAID